MRPRGSLGHSDTLAVILGALAIAIGASTLGLAVNHFSPRGIPLLPVGEARGLPVPDQQDAVRPAYPERSRRAPATPPAGRGSDGASAPENARRLPTTIPLPKGLSPITIAEAKIAFDKHTALFLDTRPPDQYGEGHLPGALSLPADAFDDIFPNLADRIEASPFLIVYCEGAECSDSIHVAERLLEYGFLGTRVMEAGYRAWSDARHPVTKGAKP